MALRHDMSYDSAGGCRNRPEKKRRHEMVVPFHVVRCMCYRMGSPINFNLGSHMDGLDVKGSQTGGFGHG